MKNKLSKEDKKLLEFYEFGFSDELEGITRKVESKYKKAYNLGSNHAIGGMDGNIGILSDEETLEIIKE
jgi:hypothetical protein